MALWELFLDVYLTWLYIWNVILLTEREKKETDGVKQGAAVAS